MKARLFHETGRMMKALAVVITGASLLLPLSGEAQSPLVMPSVTSEHVRLTDYAGIVEPGTEDWLPLQRDWLEAKSLMHAHLSSSGYIIMTFLALLKDGTFQQGTKWGLSKIMVNTRTGRYEVDHENHLLTLVDAYGITRQNEATSKPRYVKTRLPEKSASIAWHTMAATGSRNIRSRTRYAKSCSYCRKSCLVMKRGRRSLMYAATRSAHEKKRTCVGKDTATVFSSNPSAAKSLARYQRLKRETALPCTWQAAIWITAPVRPKTQSCAAMGRKGRGKNHARALYRLYEV